jgi:RNA polymerase sigma-70 factor (ECF subfamily)
MAMTLSKKTLTGSRKCPVDPTWSQAPDTEFCYEMLFQEFWDQLCGVLYRLLGDWAEAEDLALETFLQLYRRPPRDKDNLGGWLYRVATNLGLNALRRRKRRQRYEEQSGELELSTQAEQDPSVLVEHGQERDLVRSILASLKPRLAQVLILRHTGLSYAEIALALQVAPGSVGTLLARAEREFEIKYKKEAYNAS